MLTGLLKVRCAICNRQVDRITHEFDNARRMDRFVAECHGAVDICELDLTEMMQDGVVRLASESVAFAKRQIAA